MQNSNINYLYLLATTLSVECIVIPAMQRELNLTHRILDYVKILKSFVLIYHLGKHYRYHRTAIGCFHSRKNKAENSRNIILEDV